jgi:hypothetical protein
MLQPIDVLNYLKCSAVSVLVLRVISAKVGALRKMYLINCTDMEKPDI